MYYLAVRYIYIYIYTHTRNSNAIYNRERLENLLPPHFDIHSIYNNK
jgi:hypothetical protein